MDVNRGRLILITGCMFSGKTDTMTDMVHRHLISGKRCIIIKHNADTRYEPKNEGIVCNNGVEKSHVEVVTASALAPLWRVVKLFDVIGVTELQFFSGITILDEWASLGKIVICEGLVGTYKREPFGEMHLLIPLCDKIVHKRAVCLGCGGKAPFTARLSADTTTIVCGGLDMYNPLCRACYARATKDEAEQS